jgi:hypothetical protein
MIFFIVRKTRPMFEFPSRAPIKHTVAEKWADWIRSRLTSDLFIAWFIDCKPPANPSQQSQMLLS